MSSMSPDLLSLMFSGKKMPWEDEEDNAGTPAPGMMMRPPTVPGAADPATAQPAPAQARVSDDPSVTGLPPIPAAPKLRAPNPDLLAKLNTARTPIDPAQYKPKWHDYLAGALATYGATSRDPSGAYGVGDKLVHRRLNEARDNQSRNVDSLSQQLEQEDKANKDYNAGQESEFNNQLAVAKEGRERQTAQNTAGYHNDMLELRASMAADKLAQAQKQLAAMEERAKTDAGYRMQMLANQKELLDLREKVAGGGAKATTGQSLAIQGKRDKAWDKAHTDYAKALGMLGKNDTEGRKQAQQDYYDARQEAQNEYEDAIGIGGGTAQHVELPRNHFGEQPDAAAQPAAAAPASAAPATKPAGAKSVAKSVVQDYAKSHKLTYQQAEQGFKSKGYQIK